MPEWLLVDGSSMIFRAFYGIPQTMRAPDGLGAAGPPPGNASGSVLNFGRYAGWSLGEIMRRDRGYLMWLFRPVRGGIWA